MNFAVTNQPDCGAPGDTVRITLTPLGDGSSTRAIEVTSVEWNEIELSYPVYNPATGEIDVDFPVNAEYGYGTGFFEIEFATIQDGGDQTDDEGSVAGGQFTVIALPQITRFYPTAVTSDQAVTVYGTDLLDINSWRVGQYLIRNVQRTNDTQVVLRPPLQSVSGNYSITGHSETYGQDVRSANLLRVTLPSS
jgi:hypothetical protein